MKTHHRKNAVYPTPPPPAVSDNMLSFLPTAILTLTLTLSTEEKQVLAYLISCSTTHFSNKKSTVTSVNHPPCFYCSCFRCYMSYWVKWDSSPNREVIHEIIDALEGSLGKKEKSKKQRRKGKSVKRDMLNESNSCLTSEELSFDESGTVELEESYVRKLVNFVGEKIWSVWG